MEEETDLSTRKNSYKERTCRDQGALYTTRLSPHQRITHEYTYTDICNYV